MFEHMTYESILQDMLDDVDENVDKRQGSIIFDALSPAALKLAQLYDNLDRLLKVMFLDSTYGEFLTLKGKELGVEKRLSIAATRKAYFEGASPQVGSRFFTGELYWSLLESNTLIAETPGSIGNAPHIGTTLIPARDIPGLTKATIGEIIIPGTEEEGDESYRSRIIQKLLDPILSSNKAQIKQWCLDTKGVGDASVISLWNGPNTVKGVLIDTQKKPASADLVKKVQDKIDPPDAKGRKGMGEGLATIGLIFTAVSAKALNIDISAKVSLVAGKTSQDANNEFAKVVEKYLQDIAFKEFEVRYSKIGALLANLSSVVDYKDLVVNGGVTNVTIPSESVAVVGLVNLT